MPKITFTPEAGRLSPIATDYIENIHLSPTEATKIEVNLPKNTVKFTLENGSVIEENLGHITKLAYVESGTL